MQAVSIVELALYQSIACLPTWISKKLSQNNFIQTNLFRAKVEPKAAPQRLKHLLTFVRFPQKNKVFTVTCQLERDVVRVK